jgi:hypothetical protein
MPVEVTGLNEMLHALGRIDKGITRELRKQLSVGVGGPIVADMKDEATARGLVKTGKLRSGLRPAVRGSSLFVNESARNKGYPYPAIYEFGHGGARAFMQPVVDRWGGGRLEEQMSGFLDWVESEWRA